MLLTTFPLRSRLERLKTRSPFQVSLHQAGMELEHKTHRFQLDGARLARMPDVRHLVGGGHLHGGETAEKDEICGRPEEVRARPARAVVGGKVRDPEIGM